VNEEIGLFVDFVEMDKNFIDDFDIDLLLMMMIVVNVEEKFGVRIFDDDVKNFFIVCDVVNYI